jgi:hypothetical protein
MLEALEPAWRKANPEAKSWDHPDAEELCALAVNLTRIGATLRAPHEGA